MTTDTYSLTNLVADIKATNNGRLISLSMTGTQKRAADKAVERGFVVMHSINFPGFGFATAYSLA